MFAYVRRSRRRRLLRSGSGLDVLRPDGAGVGAAVARLQQRGDPAHDRGRGGGLRRPPVRPAGDDDVRAVNGSPIRTVIVRRGNGRGSFWPFGQTASLLLTPIGTIWAPVRMASIARPSFASWSSPVGLRVPSGKISRTQPASRMRVARR